MRDQDKEYRVTPIFLTWLEYLQSEHKFETKMDLWRYVNALCDTEFNSARFNNFVSGKRKVSANVLEVVYSYLPEILEFLKYKKLSAQELAERISLYEI